MADGVRTRFEWPVGGAAERKKREGEGGPVAGVLRGAGVCRGAWP
jgi:hypothetical protein